MSAESWDVPQTEDGLRDLLSRIETCRAEAQSGELGFGLLALSHLVKWVRSDTEADPFTRSGELAAEALEIFRRTDNARGKVKALVAAVPFAGPEKVELLAEAEKLAEQIEDQNYKAMVLSAQGRMMGVRDRTKAAELSHKALDLYRKTGNRSGLASCLFSLSILEGNDYEERLAAATESAEIYRELGRPQDAARSVALAIMAAEHVRNPIECEALARQGLSDALESAYWSQAQRFTENIAQYLADQGRTDEAEMYTVAYSLGKAGFVFYDRTSRCSPGTR